MLDFEQLFHSYCNIISGTYKGVCGWEGMGWVKGEGGQLKVGVTPSVITFTVALSPRSASYRPRHAWRA